MTIMHASRSRAGWNEAEREQLFSLASAARASGRPLRAVFEDIAVDTGRKPNSIRNFYYANICAAEDGATHNRRAFRPFTDEESVQLMESVLSAQAAGESVRSCTLRLADGDDKAMLRYQNKYRSMLKNAPQQVRHIYEAMLAEGRPAFDPYADRGDAPHVGRPRKCNIQLDTGVIRMLANLRRVPGLDCAALLDALGKLALSAIRGAEEHTQPESALRAENAALKLQLGRQLERYRTLLGYFTQLIRINSEFLSLNSVVKVSNLSAYIRDLESNVRNCEQLMTHGEEHTAFPANLSVHGAAE